LGSFTLEELEEKQWEGVETPNHDRKKLLEDLIHAMNKWPDQPYFFTLTGDTLVAGRNMEVEDGDFPIIWICKIEKVLMKPTDKSEDF
jgi:hypothetical protein